MYHVEEFKEEYLFPPVQDPEFQSYQNCVSESPYNHFRVNGSSVDISFPPMSVVRNKCPKGCDWAYVVAMRGLQQEYHSNDIDVSILN